MGSLGPTTSVRMDACTPPLLARGLSGMIGKGLRGAEVVKAMQEHPAVYFAAVGGAAALMAQCVASLEVIAKSLEYAIEAIAANKEDVKVAMGTTH